MPDTGLLFLSVACLMAASGFVLFPDPLRRASEVLNRTLVMLDHVMMRYRYLIAVALFVTS